MPVLWVVFARGFWRFFDHRRRDTLFRQFPDALGMIVRSVRAGIPVARAIRIVAEEGGPPTAAEFAHLADQVAIGVPLEAALRGMAERSGLGEYRFFATALALQAQTGGGLTETLENLADVIRKRVALKQRGHALASEARTSAGILASLPIVTFFGLWLIKPAYITVLLDDPGGQKILGTAIGMLGMGMMVMRSIIRRSLRVNAALLLPAAAAGMLLLSIACAVLLRLIRREERIARRLLGARQQAGAAAAVPIGADRGQMVLTLVGRLGAAIERSGILPARTLQELRDNLTGAGVRAATWLPFFVGVKVLLLFGCPLLVLVALHSTSAGGRVRTALVLAAGIIGLLAPDFVLRHARKRYLKQLERGLPDALDMMIICAEAGLGLEPAIRRVAAEIRAANRPIAAEFGQLATEMRLNSDTRVALVNIGRRTGLEGLKRFGTTLVQTLTYGTPLSQALRVLSAEMRQEMLTRFEARAARLPVLLTLPMIIFILPTVFLVVGGPAVMQAVRTMSGH